MVARKRFRSGQSVVSDTHVAQEDDHTAYQHAALRRLIASKEKQAHLHEYLAYQRHLGAKADRDIKKSYFSMFLTIIAALALYIVGNVVATRQQFPIPLKWYKGEAVEGAVGESLNGKTVYGFQRGPRPKGTIHFNPACLPIVAEYRPLASLLSLFGVCQSAERSTALFLLSFITVYFNNVKGIHYSGDHFQLNRDRLGYFLTDFQKWLDPENPFSWLYPTYLQFANSVAVMEARNAEEGEVNPASWLYQLYTGGLCYLCQYTFSSRTDVVQAWYHLLGQRAVFFRPCQAQRMADAMRNSTLAMSVAATATGLALGWTSAGTAVGSGIVTLGTSMGLSAAGMSAAVVPGYVATAGAAVANASAASAAAAAGTVGIEMTTLGATTAAATTAGASAASVAAGGAAAGTATAGAVGAANFWNPVGWCILAIVCVTLITAAVAVAVGAATGAITYYTDKCEGGTYFMMIDGQEVEWNGDVSAFNQ